VLTSQERKGQTFLSLFHDECPQTLIENKGSVTLYCAQAINDSGLVMQESRHFNWFTKLECGTSVYYTMPFVSEKFPELPQICFSEKIVFAVEASKGDDFEWSAPVSIINDCEQFVKIPKFGDVKLVVKVTTYTTLLTVESVSEVEISAIDIRGRLSRHEMETVLGKNPPSESRHSKVMLKSDLSRFVNAEFQDIGIESFPAPGSNTLRDNFSKSSLYKSLFTPTIPTKNEWELIEMFAYVKSFSVTFLADHDDELEKQGVASFTFDDIAFETCQTEVLRHSFCDCLF
jgi:hypothetical protein